jgi:hypothetical protein
MPSLYTRTTMVNELSKFINRDENLKLNIKTNILNVIYEISIYDCATCMYNLELVVVHICTLWTLPFEYHELHLYFKTIIQ